MQLGDILEDLTLDVAIGSIEIGRVDSDSHSCRPGSLFFALPGQTSHGSRYARDAELGGAVCIVSSEPLEGLGVPVVQVPSSQLFALCAHSSSVVVGEPERRTQLVGVTGTNGKTTVTTLVASLARAIGWNGANIGTLTNERTTPSSPELFRTLERMVGQFDPEVTRSLVAMEVSSHAIDQRRIEGLTFKVVAFTNLGHDHLDYHQTMERYFETKAQLFTLEHAQRAVVWADDPYGARLADLTDLPVTAVSRSEASQVQTSLRGTTFVWHELVVNSPLIGGYNVENSLMAMSIMRSLGAREIDIARAMSEVPSIPGRFELVSTGQITVVVDYAHTPEGLRRLLSDVRELMDDGQLITVFGCGGDRDRDKRPQMGSVVTSLSDITIVTSDNPRSEPPDAIIEAIMVGVAADSHVYRLSDRRSAIAKALEIAEPGDVVVLAGKGHETTQVVGDQMLPFDDRVVAKELLR